MQLPKIINAFFDDIYPHSADGQYQQRSAVRGIIFDQHGRIPILKIEADDIFGHRDHYDLVGGGVDEGESLGQAAVRECLEEAGAVIEDVHFHFGVINTYNLINTFNINYAFSANVKEIVKHSWTAQEQELVVALEWHSPRDLLHLLTTYPCDPQVGRLLHRRNTFILEKTLEIIGK